MNLIEPAIFILLFAIISVPLATRFKIPLEVFLVIGSCLISLMPGLPHFEINPLIIFYLFLPPILFYAAYFTSWTDFKINIRPISLLAVILVIVTTIAVAVVTKILFPNLSWAEGFLLGAIVSPTDAAAATTIIKKVGAPRRLIAIIEGESLVNDATALVLFRFALGAILIGSFSLPAAGFQFIAIAAGGVTVGLIIALVGITLIQKIHSAPAETTFTFLTPFVSYLVAENLHASGVIATVTCGIYFGIHFPKLTTSQTRINAKASWNTLIFIINGFIFTLMGLQLGTVLNNLQPYSLTFLVTCGAILSAVVIAVRLVWVFSSSYLTRIIFPVIAKSDPMPPARAIFILGWSGMRGIVSLAAVLSIPYQTLSGDPFPHRYLFLFLTYAVIVTTLILPTITLPFFLKQLGLANENRLKQEAIARIHSLQAVLGQLEQCIRKEKIPENIFNEFKTQVERKLKVLMTQLNDVPFSTLNEDYLALKRLTLIAIESERVTLIELRKAGEIQDDVFHQLSDELDLEEMRTKTIRI